MIAKNAGVKKKTSVVWSVIASTIVALWTLLLSPSISLSSELQLGVDTVRFAMTHTRNYVAQGNEDRIGMIADIAAGMGASSFDDLGRASVNFAKANADNVTALAAKHAARHFAVQAGGMTAGAGVGAAYGYSQGGWEGAIDGAFSGAQIGSMLGGIGADLLVACFAAGTPLVVGFDGSSRPIDEIEVNDLVLARNEFDPNGPLELKRVEEKFVRVAVVMELVIQGQSIKTTAEHPFFVPAQHRFVTAGELKAGDQLVSHDGQLITVASVCSTEAVTTVYNLRVADHHTYFVGGNHWGWDVWVHNAGYLPRATRNQDALRTDGLIEHLDPRTNLIGAASYSELHGDHVLAKAVFKNALKQRSAVIGRKLTFAELRQVNALLNGKENLRPMLGNFNMSKQDFTAAQWQSIDSPITREVNASYFDNVSLIQTSVQSQLKSLLRRFK